MMLPAKILTSKETYFLKNIPEHEDSLIFFYIIDHSVCDQFSHIWNKIRQEVTDRKLGKMFFKWQSYISGLEKLTRSII